MNTAIEGRPAFAHMHVDLDPGESIIAESDAMSSMSADLDMTAKFNGGFFSGLCKKYLGGESLFINEFKNNTDGPRRVTLVQPTQQPLPATRRIHRLYAGREARIEVRRAGVVNRAGRSVQARRVRLGHGLVWRVWRVDGTLSGRRVHRGLKPSCDLRTAIETQGADGGRNLQQLLWR